MVRKRSVRPSDYAEFGGSAAGWARRIFRTMGLGGSTELLHRLGGRAKRFSILSRETGLDDLTLSRRLRQMQAVGLLWPRPIKAGRRRTREYYLLDTGRDVLRFIRREDRRWRTRRWRDGRRRR